MERTAEDHSRATTTTRTASELSYIVVTPSYNEEANLPATIKSMVSQEAKPLVWVVVDDGSSDNTWDLIDAAAKRHPWILGLRREKQPDDNPDGLLVASEAQAFLDGYQAALDQGADPDFIVKLDADLEFGPEYFNSLIEELRRDPHLGIAGGVIYEYKGDDLVLEKVSKAHVRGATKIYRRDCYRDIGGVHPVFGWDVIDEILARAKGWRVQSFSHVPLTHLRRTASREGRFVGWVRNGYMAYYIGMSPFRMLTRALSRLLTTGDIVQSAGLTQGYFSHFLRRTARLPDVEVRRLVKKHQWATLGAYVSRSAGEPQVKRCNHE